MPSWRCFTSTLKALSSACASGGRLTPSHSGTIAAPSIRRSGITFPTSATDIESPSAATSHFDCHLDRGGRDPTLRPPPCRYEAFCRSRRVLPVARKGDCLCSLSNRTGFGNLAARLSTATPCLGEFPNRRHIAVLLPLGGT